MSEFDRIACKTRREWLAERHKLLGASDVAGVLGRSDYTSPYGVWYHKTSEPDLDDDQDIRLRVGHALEPLTASLFTEATGIATHDPGDFTLYRSKRWPWLGCTLDRHTIDGTPVELKTAMYDAAKAWKTAIPLAYQIQLQVQMAVTGAATSYIAVLCNCDTLRWHECKRHEPMIRAIVKRTGDFWRDHVEANVAPRTDGTTATSDALASRYPSGDGFAELPADFDKLGPLYDRLNARAKRAEKAKKTIANRVKEKLGPASVGALGDGSGFRWSGADGRRRFTRVEKVKRDE